MLLVPMEHRVDARINGGITYARVIRNVADPIAFFADQVAGYAGKSLFTCRSAGRTDTDETHGDRFTSVRFQSDASGTQKHDTAARAGQVTYAGGCLPAILFESKRQLAVGCLNCGRCGQKHCCREQEKNYSDDELASFAG